RPRAGLRAVERLPDHAHCRLGEAVLREIDHRYPLHVGRVGAATERAADRAADEIDEHEVVEDTAVHVEPDAIEDVDHRADVDHQAGFFLHLSRDRDLERFADLDRTARQAPLAFQRLVSTADEEHARAVDDYGADADD